MGLVGSKIFTPSSISWIITSLDSSKTLFSSSVHLKGVPDRRSWRNGSIRSATEKAYDTWFSNPNHECTLVMVLGVGNSRIALRYCLHGLTLSGVISNPANSIVSHPKTNFSGLSVIP